MSLSPEIVILLMFSTLMLLMLTGQRVFAAMGFVGVARLCSCGETEARR